MARSNERFCLAFVLILLMVSMVVGSLLVSKYFLNFYFSYEVEIVIYIMTITFAIRLLSNVPAGTLQGRQEFVKFTFSELFAKIIET